MLFNSYAFIFFFLPTAVCVYFILNKQRYMLAAQAWMVLASLFFYAWWNPDNLFVFMTSVLVNYGMGAELAKPHSQKRRKRLLAGGIIFNVGLLGYYKYSAFVVDNINQVTGAGFPVPAIVLPLAISFFTFQQIAYLVDTYRHGSQQYGFLRYILFVSFFPHLIAGPILHHKEILSQFARMSTKIVRWKNIYAGLFLFAVGLMKKVGLADWLSTYVSEGYAAETLTTIDAWKTTLAYTFQIYFDFSGYCDMAMGAATLVNIRLPINFNSPYKAVNIQDFWHRWHMTLSRWLKEYLYIPLGGNRHGQARTYFNLWIVFVIGGIWHGANWTFLIWGLLHGSAIVIHRIWQQAGKKMSAWAGVALTFLFVHVTWVFFRAPSVDSALHMLKTMFVPAGGIKDIDDLLFVLPLLFVVMGTKNSMAFFHRVDARRRWGVFVIFSLILFILLNNRISEFIYFNF